MSRTGLTDSRQRNAVSEGLALGVLMCGTDRIGYADVDGNFKIAADFAFLHAWRRWPHRNLFPRVARDTELIDPIWIAVHADERRQVSLYWEQTSTGYVVRQRGRWANGMVDPDDAAASIDGGLEPAAWASLAQPFLDHLRSDRR